MAAIQSLFLIAWNLAFILPDQLKFHMKIVSTFIPIYISRYTLIWFKQYISAVPLFILIGDPCFPHVIITKHSKAYMGDSTQGGEWLLKMGQFFYGETYISLDIKNITLYNQLMCIN